MTNIYNEMIEFSKKHIAPYTTNVDEKAQFPVDSFKAIKKEKLTGLIVPKEFGGLGYSLEEHTQTVLAFATSCATTALCYMMHNVATMCIVAYGSSEMKNEYLCEVVPGMRVRYS